MPRKPQPSTRIVLSETAEQQVREILEQGDKGVDAAARADAQKFGAFYGSFMDEANVEKLDVAPITPLLARNARIILSGLLMAQANAVLSAYRAQGLVLEKRVRLDEWATLTLIRGVQQRRATRPE